MFYDELDKLEKNAKHNEREDKSLIPIDSYSHLDTGYTGRPDTDMLAQDERIKSKLRVEVRLCRFCDQPMKPKGIKKLPNQYDHAQGCPYNKKGK